MLEYRIPLIIRGRIIEDDWVKFEGRRGEITFFAPDAGKYLDQIVLRDPVAMSDLYEQSMDDILDYLDELGLRLELDQNRHMQDSLAWAVHTSGSSAAILERSYRAVPHMLRRDFVSEVIERNIGREYLEGWVPRRLNDGRTVNVRAFGARAVSINAGNSPGIATHTVLHTAVTRSDTIVKLPSNDPFSTLAVIRTMLEMAPDNPITKHFTVAYWKGGDEAFESRLYSANNIEKIKAWGGHSSMEHIRRYLGPGLDLVALDPKFSFAIIGREAFASDETMRSVARAAARDVGYFNQEGCISCRSIFSQSGSDESGLAKLNRFGEMLFEEIQLLPATISSLHPAFDRVLKQEIDGIRYSDDYKVFGGRANEGAVIVSQFNELVDFAPRLSGRTVNLVPVNEMGEAVAAVTIHSSTIGVYPDELKEKIRNACALRGAQRLTSLGFMTAEAMANPHDGIEQLRRQVRWITEENLQNAHGPLGTMAIEIA